jgi:hypothetical protein
MWDACPGNQLLSAPSASACFENEQNVFLGQNRRRARIRLKWFSTSPTWTAKRAFVVHFDANICT